MTNAMAYAQLAHIEAHLDYWEEHFLEEDFVDLIGSDDVRALIEEVKRLRRLVGEPYPGQSALDNRIEAER